MHTNDATATVLPDVLFQHAEEAAFLAILRQHHLRASHIKLTDLARHDDRIAAHLDGLRIAGADGINIAQQRLENPGAGELFVATLLALESKSAEKLNPLLALAEALPDAQAGFFSAFGWVSSQFLQGTIKNLLASNVDFHRLAGITCCALQRANPGAALEQAIKSNHPALITRALKATGELGRRDLMPLCEALCKDTNPSIQFWACWSAALLGSKQCLSTLSEIAFQPNAYQLPALAILLKALPSKDAHAYLQNIAKNPANQRALIQGAGIAGDPFYIPWLIKQMADAKNSRLAGEAFSFITGVDIAYQKLDAAAPEALTNTPTDKPEELNIEINPDENLPVPDPHKINHWWNQNVSHYHNGQRYFMGQPVSEAHCTQVLKTGFQRQRVAAALYLCMLKPGSMLFPTSAPAWRQQRLLNKLN